MENQNIKRESSDEIDVSSFFSVVGRGLRNFGISILYSLGGLRKTFIDNRLLFVSLILIGLVGGAVYSEVIKKKYYRASMVLSCDYLNTQIVNNTIDKLNLLAHEKTRQGLARELGIDEATARKIYRFEARPFISEDDVVELEILRTQLNNLAEEKKDLVTNVVNRLEIQNKNAYDISILVYEPDIVPFIEDDIVNYFRNNSYIKRRIEINKINLANRKNKLLKEVRKIDSIKTAIFQSFHTFRKTAGGSNNVILGDEQFTDPVKLFQQDLDMFMDLLSVEKQLYIQSDFELVDNLTAFKEPESAGLIEILAYSFLLAMLFGYLIIGLARFDRLLATRYVSFKA